ncbi:GreA/GreB family elongation factor [bacterium]|nr:GreA/GreB family elongation factor [bacterium]
MSAIFLTKDGFKSLESELKELQKTTLPAIKVRMANAREDGDLSENNAWITAKEEMEIARMRVSEIKAMLKTAQLVEETGKKANTVQLGDEVTIKINGNTVKTKIVPTMEADPTAGKLSSDSPIGRAVLGKKVGDTVEVVTPAGTQTAEIIRKS